MSIYIADKTGAKLGALTGTKNATITQEINGEYVLHLVCSLSDISADYIKPDAIIYAVDVHGEEIFRVCRTVRNMQDIEVEAWHITQDLAHALILDRAWLDKSGKEIMPELLQASDLKGFTGTSDIIKTAGVRYVRRNVLSAIMGDEENALIKRIGGELSRRGRVLGLMARLGKDGNTRVAFGENLTDIAMALDYAPVINRIVPTYLASNDTPRLLPEVVMDSPSIGLTAVPHAVAVHFGDIKVGDADPDGVVHYETEQDAERAVRKAVEAYFATVDAPSFSVDVSFVDIDKDLSKVRQSLTALQLGDNVDVLVDGYNAGLRLVSYTWNAITCKYERLTLGQVKTSLEAQIRKSTPDAISAVVTAAEQGASTGKKGLELIRALANASGLYTTEIVGTDGKKRTYFHDKARLEDSSVIEYYPAPGTRMWTNTGWNNGAPLFQYGYTNAGELVMRVIHTHKISADIIELNNTPIRAYIDNADAKGALKASELIKAETDARTALANIFTAKIVDLQGQVDGAITTWSYDGAPTATNAPAVDWATDEIKNKHLGDVYYDRVTGYAYRYQVLAGVYSWARLTDTDITKALKDAATAKDLADGKRRHFIRGNPAPPYDEGDQWTTADGVLMVCIKSRSMGAYDEADWQSLVAYASRAELDAVGTKLAKDIADLANDDTITPYEATQIKQSWQVIQAEYQKIIAMLAAVDREKRANAENEYKASYNALSAVFTPIIANLGTYSTIDGVELNKALSRYSKARADVGAVIATINGEQFATLESGLFQMGERVGVYEAQVKITPEKITLNTLAGGRSIEAASITASRFSFLVDGKEVAYLSNQKLFITDAEVKNSIRIGVHIVETSPTGHTLFRYIGGAS